MLCHGVPSSQEGRVNLRWSSARTLRRLQFRIPEGNSAVNRVERLGSNPLRGSRGGGLELCQEGLGVDMLPKQLGHQRDRLLVLGRQRTRRRRHLGVLVAEAAGLLSRDSAESLWPGGARVASAAGSWLSGGRERRWVA